MITSPYKFMFGLVLCMVGVVLSYDALLGGGIRPQLVIPVFIVLFGVALGAEAIDVPAYAKRPSVWRGLLGGYSDRTKAEFKKEIEKSPNARATQET